MPAKRTLTATSRPVVRSRARKTLRDVDVSLVAENAEEIDELVSSWTANYTKDEAMKLLGDLSIGAPLADQLGASLATQGPGH